MDDKTQTELEAAVYRRLVEHLRGRTDVQNIDMMNLAGFCRNCLSNWMKDAADAKGVPMTKDQSREIVYGEPFEQWKAKHQKEASKDQKAAFEKSYAQVYGLTIPDQKVEAITWSVTVSSRVARPRRVAKVRAVAAPGARSMRLVYDPALARIVKTPVVWRFDMKPGARIKGPAVIAEDETSTVVGSRFSASINARGDIVMERNS